MKSFIFALIFGFSQTVFAEDKIKLTINELNNVGRSDALEACGKAVHVEGIKPLLVKVTHDKSSYTVITDKDGKWCVTFKRWNFSGTTKASASTLNFEDESSESKMK